jgi:hypothetical protein
MTVAAKLPSTAISGTIRVYVVPCEPLEDDQAGDLYMVVERFLDALRLGVFPGTLERVHSITREDDGKVDARFDVAELELGALRVLYGTLTYFSIMVAPLGTVMAWTEPVGSTPNLFDFDAPLPVHRGGLPFDTRLEISEADAAPPLVVEVVFGRALTAEEKDRFDWEIQVWASLVQGGYPEPGDLPGSSAIGPLTVRYDDPQTLRLSAEALLAGEACLEPLKALVAEWAASVPVVSVATG